MDCWYARRPNRQWLSLECNLESARLRRLVSSISYTCVFKVLYIIADMHIHMSLFSIDTAIVNGDIKEPRESQITSQEAINMGVCIHTSEESSCNWQLIDYDLELEGKPQSAVTIWRTLKQWSGVKDALNETVSLVELKPKSGRHHQENLFDLSLPLFDYPCKSYVLTSVTISSLSFSTIVTTRVFQLRRHMVSDVISES